MIRKEYKKINNRFPTVNARTSTPPHLETLALSILILYLTDLVLSSVGYIVEPLGYYPFLQKVHLASNKIPLNENNKTN